MPTTDNAVRALADKLGSAPAAASRVPWGDSQSTYRVELEDGRAFSARLLSGPDAFERAQVQVHRFDRLGARGIGVPRPADLCHVDDSRTWVVTPWVDGIVGAQLLDHPTRGPRLADAMGRLAGHLAQVDQSGLSLDLGWAGPNEMLAMATESFQRLHGHLDARTRARARASVDVVQTAWDSGSEWTLGVAHGDYAPINVIYRPDGSLALLDLDTLRVGPRLLDIAWWGWIVRYHHAIDWARTWTPVVEGAGLKPSPAFDEVAIAVGRTLGLERAAGARDLAARSSWLRRLVETATW